MAVRFIGLLYMTSMVVASITPTHGTPDAIEVPARAYAPSELSWSLMNHPVVAPCPSKKD